MVSTIKLDWAKWNSYVSNATQCALLPHNEEIKYLSSKDPALAQYLEKHPEMAHELMIPSGFHQCLIRRFERYLGGQEALSAQDGSLDNAKRGWKVFDAMLPGSPKVISNPDRKPNPTWRMLNSFVCTTGTCTKDEETIAPEYMDISSGKRVRIVKYMGMEIEVTLEQWHVMWDHDVCHFVGVLDEEDVEFVALHKAREQLAHMDKRFLEWQFPGGQQIAILQKQLEHRLRAAHRGRPNSCSECCPWRSTNDPDGTKYKQFLTKEEAAKLVIEDRAKKGKKLKCIYDPVIYQVLKKRGVDVPADFLKWQTAEDLDKAISG